ncbi:MAG: hypothetical protein ABSD47_17320 [Candidatus Methylomirabilota bacterium]|jgi:hypothetical protein
MKAARLPHWLLPVCLIPLLAGVGYGLLLRPGEILYSPHSDIVAYHLAAKEVLFRSWHAGRGLPFWRADQLAGGPALTNPNSLYTYPLHFLFYVLHPADAMNWTIWLHLVIGAWAFYALGRSLDLGGWPCVLMAVAALFNFKVLMAVYAGWLSVLPSITFFPLLFAVTLRALKSSGPGSALAVAATGALCLHTGQLQLVYYSGWFLVAYLLVTLAGWWRAGRRQEVGRAVGWLVVGGVLAIGMATYLLLPLAAEAPLVSRGQASDAFFHSGHALGARHLLTLLYPEALGSPLDGSYPDVELWEDVAYFGLVPLFLALVGAVLGRRRPPAGFLIAGLLTSLLFALDTPFLRLPYALLPGFRLFRLPGRLLFLAAFFGIALAGIGLEELLARLQKARPRSWRPHLVATAMVLLIAGEGAAYAHRYLAVVDHAEVAPAPDYGRFFAADRTLFRIAPVGRYTVSYGWAAAMKLQLISGYEPFNLRHYQQYFGMMQSGRERREDATVWTDLIRVARWDLLDALNVKYLLAPFPLQLPPDRFEPVGSFRNQPVFVFYQGVERIDVFAYRNTHVLPRVFWAERVVVAPDENHMRSEVLRGDLSGVAVVEGTGPTSGFSQGSTSDHAKVVEAADGYLTVEAESQTSRFLVISEIWHPGWRALLDGRPLPIVRADLALMGAWLPAGRHRLVLEFRPLHWRTALSISVFSACAFLTLLVVHFVRLREPRAGVP